MSYVLTGPWTFDPAAVVASGRTALNAVESALRAGKASALAASAATGEAPGLYVILRTGEEGARIAGFWVSFAPTYLDEGTPGPPDRHPPYASGLMDAATEEVWWKNLKVNDDGHGTWRPVVVLEWPPSLATRSETPPPGVFGRAVAEQSSRRDEGEGWLEAPVVPRPAPDRPMVVEVREEKEDPYAGLPARRSLVTVIQGQLTYDRSFHKGRTFIVPPALFERAPRSPAIALDDWLDLASKATEAEVQQALSDAGTPVQGYPLLMPGARIGFPLAGWLTRQLDRWPGRPAEIEAATLSDRVVQTRWVGQVLRAVVSMTTVLALVGGLAVGVRIAAEPRPQPARVPPAPAPQPAMSVCSEENDEFVEELRCQVSRLSSTSETFPTDPWCGDDGSQEVTTASTEDLQAAWCGLYDRAVDGWTGNRVQRKQTYNFAHLAAAQACFNVLGHPYPYAQPTGFSEGRLFADPALFLEDESLGIASLVDLVGTLDKACETYRSRVESRVEGAVFATHIGAPFNREDRFAGGQRESAAASLRRLMVGVAAQGQSGDAVRCFEEGVHEGLDAGRYDQLCGAADRIDDGYKRKKIWTKLAGKDAVSAEGLIDRYVAARFGLGGEAPAKKDKFTDVPLWQCHLGLTGVSPLPVGRNVAAFWDLSLPVPASYNIGGAGVKEQLRLDAGLRAFEGGLTAGTCWDLVRRRVIAYEPVHPLLAELDEEGWPNGEQQLCGQICASVYRIANGPGRDTWVTPEQDLGLCLNADPPDLWSDGGRGTFDRLRLPWNGMATRDEPDRTWRKPRASQICAFNLVAQNYFPEGDEGFLVGGKSPIQWAGETRTGSRVAGGADGLARDAIDGMMRSSSGSGWSVGRCGHVATACFTSVLFDVLGKDGRDGKEKVERYEWLSQWSGEIERLANERPRVVAEEQPWCLPIQPYLSLQREMAQFDAPCRQGVNTARQNVERSIRTFAAGGSASAENGEQ